MLFRYDGILAHRVGGFAAEQLQVAVEVFWFFQAHAGCPTEGQGPGGANVGLQDAAEDNEDGQVDDEHDKGCNDPAANGAFAACNEGKHDGDDHQEHGQGEDEAHDGTADAQDETEDGVAAQVFLNDDLPGAFDAVEYAQVFHHDRHGGLFNEDTYHPEDGDHDADQGEDA